MHDHKAINTEERRRRVRGDAERYEALQRPRWRDFLLVIAGVAFWWRVSSPRSRCVSVRNFYSTIGPPQPSSTRTSSTLPLRNSVQGSP